MSKNSLPLFFLFFYFGGFAQTCNCPESFNWMVNIFEKNDAGFEYIIHKKGKDDYNKHLSVFREKVKQITKPDECQAMMNSWLRYFRSGHIAVILKQQAEEKQLSDIEIRIKYLGERKITITENEIKKELDSKTNRNSLEGIWNNGTYRIGIIPDKKNPEKFLGVILKADSVYWMPGQVKAEFTFKNKEYTTEYYMRDHSKQTYSCIIPDTNCAIFSINGDYWKREYPRTRLTGKEQLLISFSRTRVPFVEKLSDKTLYLRIPSFAVEEKKNIDSVLLYYDSQIKSTLNLIIDIRYGTGGSDASYEKILPYVYTNPIRSVGIQLLATEMNAKAFEEYAKQYEDTSDVNYCKQIAKKMRANIGKFIDTDAEKFSIDSSHSVLPLPQKVAIICNKYNGSTDEQFLLDVKQSRKVKVYGHSTGGMLDVSNMNFVDSPDKRFSLGYCMSKSYRIPNYCIDGIGIQPDHFIDDTIEEEDWIYYVQREMEK